MALTLDATIAEGELIVTKSMIAASEQDGDCWRIRHGGLVFRFERCEVQPASGPYGVVTHAPKAWRNTPKPCKSERPAARPGALSWKGANQASDARTAAPTNRSRAAFQRRCGQRG